MNFLISSRRWDEWVPADRIKKINDANRQLQISLRKTHAAEASAFANEPPSAVNPQTSRKRREKDSGDEAPPTAPIPEKPQSAKRPKTPSQVSRLLFESLKCAIQTDDFDVEAIIERKNATPQSKNAARKKAQILFTVAFDAECAAILVADADEITKNRKLVDIPLVYNVQTILHEWTHDRTATAAVADSEAEVRCSFAEALQKYFDRLLGQQLLYRFERPQYADWHAAHAKDAAIRPSEAYGFAHLLRLIVVLPQILAEARMPLDACALRIKTLLDDLLAFMTGARSRFFAANENYVYPPPQYENHF